MIEGWVAVLGLMLVAGILFGLVALAGLVVYTRSGTSKSRH